MAGPMIDGAIGIPRRQTPAPAPAPAPKPAPKPAATQPQTQKWVFQGRTYYTYAAFSAAKVRYAQAQAAAVARQQRAKAAVYATESAAQQAAYAQRAAAEAAKVQARAKGLAAQRAAQLAAQKRAREAQQAAELRARQQAAAAAARKAELERQREIAQLRALQQRQADANEIMLQKRKVAEAERRAQEERLRTGRREAYDRLGQRQAGLLRDGADYLRGGARTPQNTPPPSDPLLTGKSGESIGQQVRNRPEVQRRRANAQIERGNWKGVAEILAEQSDYSGGRFVDMDLYQRLQTQYVEPSMQVGEDFRNNLFPELQAAQDADNYERLVQIAIENEPLLDEYLRLFGDGRKPGELEPVAELLNKISRQRDLSVMSTLRFNVGGGDGGEAGEDPMSDGAVRARWRHVEKQVANGGENFTSQSVIGPGGDPVFGGPGIDFEETRKNELTHTQMVKDPRTGKMTPVVKYGLDAYLAREQARERMLHEESWKKAQRDRAHFNQHQTPEMLKAEQLAAAGTRQITEVMGWNEGQLRGKIANIQQISDPVQQEVELGRLLTEVSTEWRRQWKKKQPKIMRFMGSDWESEETRAGRRMDSEYNQFMQGVSHLFTGGAGLANWDERGAYLPGFHHILTAWEDPINSIVNEMGDRRFEGKPENAYQWQADFFTEEVNEQNPYGLPQFFLESIDRAPNKKDAEEYRLWLKNSESPDADVRVAANRRWREHWIHGNVNFAADVILDPLNAAGLALRPLQAARLARNTASGFKGVAGKTLDYMVPRVQKPSSGRARDVFNTLNYHHVRDDKMRVMVARELGVPMNDAFNWTDAEWLELKRLSRPGENLIGESDILEKLFKTTGVSRPQLLNMVQQVVPDALRKFGVQAGDPRELARIAKDIAVQSRRAESAAKAGAEVAQRADAQRIADEALHAVRRMQPDVPGGERVAAAGTAVRRSEEALTTAEKQVAEASTLRAEQAAARRAERGIPEELFQQRQDLERRAQQLPGSNSIKAGHLDDRIKDVRDTIEEITLDAGAHKVPKKLKDTLDELMTERENLVGHEQRAHWWSLQEQMADIDQQIVSAQRGQGIFKHFVRNAGGPINDAAKFVKSRVGRVWGSGRQAHLGRGLYLSLDDVRWGRRLDPTGGLKWEGQGGAGKKKGGGAQPSNKVKGQATPTPKISYGVERLHGLEYQLNTGTNIRTISSMGELRATLKEFGIKWDGTVEGLAALNDAMRAAPGPRAIEGIAIRNLPKWRGKVAQQLKKELRGDQMIIFDPEASGRWINPTPARHGMTAAERALETAKAGLKAAQDELAKAKKAHRPNRIRTPDQVRGKRDGLVRKQISWSHIDPETGKEVVSKGEVQYEVAYDSIVSDVTEVTTKYKALTDKATEALEVVYGGIGNLRDQHLAINRLKQAMKELQQFEDEVTVLPDGSLKLEKPGLVTARFTKLAEYHKRIGGSPYDPSYAQLSWQEIKSDREFINRKLGQYRAELGKARSSEEARLLTERIMQMEQALKGLEYEAAVLSSRRGPARAYGRENLDRLRPAIRPQRLAHMNTNAEELAFGVSQDLNRILYRVEEVRGVDPKVDAATLRFLDDITERLNEMEVRSLEDAPLVPEREATGVANPDNLPRRDDVDAGLWRDTRKALGGDLTISTNKGDNVRAGAYEARWKPPRGHALAGKGRIRALGHTRDDAIQNLRKKASLEPYVHGPGVAEPRLLWSEVARGFRVASVKAGRELEYDVRRALSPLEAWEVVEGMMVSQVGRAQYGKLRQILRREVMKVAEEAGFKGKPKDLLRLIRTRHHYAPPPDDAYDLFKRLDDLHAARIRAHRGWKAEGQTKPQDSGRVADDEPVMLGSRRDSDPAILALKLEIARETGVSMYAYDEMRSVFSQPLLRERTGEVLRAEAAAQAARNGTEFNEEFIKLRGLRAEREALRSFEEFATRPEHAGQPLERTLRLFEERYTLNERGALPPLKVTTYQKALLDNAWEKLTGSPYANERSRQQWMQGRAVEIKGAKLVSPEMLQANPQTRDFVSLNPDASVRVVGDRSELAGVLGLKPGEAVTLVFDGKAQAAAKKLAIDDAARAHNARELARVRAANRGKQGEPILERRPEGSVGVEGAGNWGPEDWLFSRPPSTTPGQSVEEAAEAAMQAAELLGEGLSAADKFDLLTGAITPVPWVPDRRVLYHGTSHSDPNAFIDEAGNLHIKGSDDAARKGVPEGWGGDTPGHGVFFSPHIGNSQGFAEGITGKRGLRQNGLLFEIDADVFAPGSLWRNPDWDSRLHPNSWGDDIDEIISNGDVVIPAGSFRTMTSTGHALDAAKARDTARRLAASPDVDLIDELVKGYSGPQDYDPLWDTYIRDQAGRGGFYEMAVLREFRLRLDRYMALSDETPPQHLGLSELSGALHILADTGGRIITRDGRSMRASEWAHAAVAADTRHTAMRGYHPVFHTNGDVNVTVMKDMSTNGFVPAELQIDSLVAADGSALWYAQPRGAAVEAFISTYNQRIADHIVRIEKQIDELPTTPFGDFVDNTSYEALVDERAALSAMPALDELMDATKTVSRFEGWRPSNAGEVGKLVKVGEKAPQLETPDLMSTMSRADRAETKALAESNKVQLRGQTVDVEQVLPPGIYMTESSMANPVTLYHEAFHLFWTNPAQGKKVNEMTALIREGWEPAALMDALNMAHGPADMLSYGEVAEVVAEMYGLWKVGGDGWDNFVASLNATGEQAKILGFLVDDFANVVGPGRKAMGIGPFAPPLHNRTAMRDWSVRMGRWTPKTGEAIRSGAKIWTVDEERAFYKAEFGLEPIWTDRDYLRLILSDHRAYQIAYREVGFVDDGFEELAMATGLEGKKLRDALVWGKEGLPTQRTLDELRMWASERYGDLVVDKNGKFIAMPWLMKIDSEYLPWLKAALIGDDARRELVERAKPKMTPYLRLQYYDEEGFLRSAGLELDPHLIGAGVRNPTKLLNDLKQAIYEASERRIKRMQTKEGFTNGEWIHQEILTFSYEITDRLLDSQAWRGIFRGRRWWNQLLHMAGFQRALVTFHPAFAFMNLAESYGYKRLILAVAENGWAPIGMSGMRWSHRIRTLADIGDGEVAAIFGLEGKRKFMARAADGTLHPIERIKGFTDDVVNASARASAVGESRLRLDFARVNYGKAYESFVRGGMGDEAADFMARAYARKMNTIFFATVGDSAIMQAINQAVPFFSYRLKQMQLAIRMGVQHPWIPLTLGKIQEAVIEHNRQWYIEKHGSDVGFDETSPGAHKLWIDIGDGEPLQIDLWDVSDWSRATRQAIQTLSRGQPLHKLIGDFLRVPHPLQEGLVATITGGTTPWGKPGDWREMLWFVDLFKWMTGNDYTDPRHQRDGIQIVSQLFMFKGFGRLTEGESLAMHYFGLKDAGQDQRARDFINANPALEAYFAAIKPYTNPRWSMYDGRPGGGHWYSMLSDEARAEYDEAYDTLKKLEAAYDEKVHGFATRPWSDEYRDLKRERRAAIYEFHRQNPVLRWSWGIAMTPAEFSEIRSDWVIDSQVDSYFLMISQRPKEGDFDTELEFRQAMVEFNDFKIAWLEAHPQVADRLWSNQNAIMQAWHDQELLWSEVLEFQAKLQLKIVEEETALTGIYEQDVEQREFISQLYDVKSMAGALLDGESYVFANLPLVGGSNAKQEQAGLKAKFSEWFGLGKTPDRLEAMIKLPGFADYRYDNASRSEQIQMEADEKYYGELGEMMDAMKGKDDFTEFWNELEKRGLLSRYLKENPHKTDDYEYVKAIGGIVDTYGKLFWTGLMKPENKWLLDEYLRRNPDKVGQYKYMYGMDRLWAAIGNDFTRFYDQLAKDPWLEAEYFRRNPEKVGARAYAAAIGDIVNRATSGKHFYELLDKAGWVRDEYYRRNPHKLAERAVNEEYIRWMGGWAAKFKVNDFVGAQRVWDQMPEWVKQRYLTKNPDSGMADGVMGGGGGGRAVQYKGQWFKTPESRDRYIKWVEGGSRSTAVQYDGKWFKSPESRDRYIKWIEGGRSGSAPVEFAETGSAPRFRSAESRQRFVNGQAYFAAMGEWVALLKAKELVKADDYFNNLPMWMKEKYWDKHPDQRARMQLGEDNLRKGAEYFLATGDDKLRILRNNPDLRNWLETHGGNEAAHRGLIMQMYRAIPSSDGWLKRAFKEKFPEIFSEEAQGERRLQKVARALAENPDLIPWYKKALALQYDLYRDQLKREKLPTGIGWTMERKSRMAKKRKRRAARMHSHWSTHRDIRRYSTSA